MWTGLSFFGMRCPKNAGILTNSRGIGAFDGSLVAYPTFLALGRETRNSALQAAGFGVSKLCLRFQISIRCW
jgi:hypothetical protein